MLIVAVEARVEAGAIDTVREVLRTMEEETRKESGCLTYAFSVDVNDVRTVRILERWESMDALAAHFKTEHMAAFNQALGKLRPESIDVKTYEIAREVSLPRG